MSESNINENAGDGSSPIQDHNNSGEGTPVENENINEGTPAQDATPEQGSSAENETPVEPSTEVVPDEVNHLPHHENRVEARLAQIANTGEGPPAREHIAGTPLIRKQPAHLQRVVTIWAVLSVIGIVIWLLVARFILPPVASELDQTNDFTIIFFTALAVPVALFVWVFLGYSLIVFRVKGRPTEDGLPLKATPLLQVGWLGITGALCLFLLIWGMFGFYQETTASASSPLVVQVTGQQWLWTFYYPQYDVSSQSQVLEVPVNRPVQFNVTSKDVLHGFAIRSLGIRLDANPGQTITTPIVTPNQIGSYSAVCVELCGLYHSYMWSGVNVVSTSDFNSWITSQGGHI